MTELREMPSSLNDACRKLDLAYAEIEHLRAELLRLYEKHGYAETARVLGIGDHQQTAATQKTEG